MFFACFPYFRCRRLLTSKITFWPYKSSQCLAPPTFDLFRLFLMPVNFKHLSTDTNKVKYEILWQFFFTKNPPGIWLDSLAWPANDFWYFNRVLFLVLRPFHLLVRFILAQTVSKAYVAIFIYLCQPKLYYFSHMKIWIHINNFSYPFSTN